MAKKVDRRALFKDLKKEVHPLYYLHGDDTFMLDAAETAMVKSALPEGPSAFNYDMFRGKEATAEKIQTACETLPMLSSKRLVIVKDAQEMPNQEVNELTSYFKDPSPFTTLVFVFRTQKKKPDGRSAGIKALKKASKLYEFSAFREYEIGEVLAQQAKRRGLNLTRAANQHLISAVGTDLSQLVATLERISLFIGNEHEGPVDVEHLQDIVVVTKEETIFSLTDALGARDITESMTIIDNMLLAGQSVIGIVVMIARHFRILANIHDPKVKSLRGREFAAAAGVSPFFADNYKKDAARFTYREIKFIKKQVAFTDFALKSSPLKNRSIVDALLLDICLGKSQSPRN